jgi:hypothetical protein
MHTLSKSGSIRPSRTMDTLGALSFIDTRGIHYYGKCVTSHSRLAAFLVDAEETVKQRTTASTSSQMIDHVCDLLMPKLEEHLANHLPSKQRGDGPNPSRDFAKLASARALAVERVLDSAGDAM